MFVPPPKPHLEAKWTGNMVLPSSSTPARCVTTQDAYTDKFSLNVGKCSSNGGALSWYALEDLGAVNVTYNVTGKDGTAGVQIYLRNSSGVISGSAAISKTGQFFVEKTIQLDISEGYELFVNIGKATSFGSSGMTLTEANLVITP